jgi:anti-sigma regulatory factor (Ser/Thr protein kinase)
MNEFQRSYPAVAESIGQARRELRQHVRGCGGNPALVERVALAVSEATTNVVLHAYIGREPGDFRVIAEIVDDESGDLRVTVEDDGRGMMPRLDSPGAGIGMPIIGQTSDTYEVRTSLTGGNHLCMRFALDVAAEAVERPV